MKNKKILYGILGTFVLLFGILYWLGIIGFWADNIKGYWQRKSNQEYMQEQENKIDNLIQAYKEDKYGGDTPQETLALFVDALKKGDTDLASKYFVVEKQDGMLKKLPQAFESGGAKSLIDYYYNGKLILIPFENDDMYSIRIVKNGKKVGFNFKLILNKQTHKWKILDL